MAEERGKRNFLGQFPCVEIRDRFGMRLCLEGHGGFAQFSRVNSQL